jgi:hypothetical protein
MLLHHPIQFSDARFGRLDLLLDGQLSSVARRARGYGLPLKVLELAFQMLDCMPYRGHFVVV